jgi:hypothetical protein
MEAVPFGLSRILTHPPERLQALEKEGPQVGLWECCSQTKKNG